MTWHGKNKDIISISKIWNNLLSLPENMRVAKGYPQRNAVNPPYAAMPDTIKDAPWNVSEAELLSSAADVMVYKNNIAGVNQPPIIVKKIRDNAGNPVGFEGLPVTGLTGPGILGKGSYEGLPSPVTRAVDVILLSQDEITGEIYVLLGQRPEFCFPGGFVDDGESPIFTAIREFFEEVLVASYDLGSEADFFLQGHAWQDLSKENKIKLCDILNVPHAFSKEPFIAEFKYKVLSLKKPEAVADVTAYLKALAHESYAGFVNADPRNCGRAIYTNAYSMVIDKDKFSKVLGRHGLSYDEESYEIGKLGWMKIAPEMLIKAYKFETDLGMYASHGPVLLYALAHNIKLGTLDEKLAKAPEQINAIIHAIRADIAKYEGHKTMKNSNKLNR